jgi:hypothetical protein
VAGLSSVLTVAVNPTPTRMPSWITVPNPASSNFTVYSPGATVGKRNVPFSFVVVTGVPITAGPDSVTVTPGSKAFVLSVTAPVIAPALELTVCASAELVKSRNRHPIATIRRSEFMVPSCHIVVNRGLDAPRQKVKFVRSFVRLSYPLDNFDTEARVRDSSTSVAARWAMSMAASVCELPAASAFAIEIRPTC